MLRQKLPNLLNTIGGLGAAAPKLSLRGAPRRLSLRGRTYAPHTLKGGQFSAGRSPAHFSAAKPLMPPVVFRQAASPPLPTEAKRKERSAKQATTKKIFSFCRHRSGISIWENDGQDDRQATIYRSGSFCVGSRQAAGAAAVVSGAAAGLLWGIQGQSPCRSFFLSLPPRVLRPRSVRLRRPQAAVPPVSLLTNGGRYTATAPPHLVAAGDNTPLPNFPRSTAAPRPHPAPRSRGMIPATHISAPHWR